MKLSQSEMQHLRIIPIPQVTVVSRPWPVFPPAIKCSKNSPFKTILQFGTKGERFTVQIIVQGRDQETVDGYAGLVIYGNQTEPYSPCA